MLIWCQYDGVIMRDLQLRLSSSDEDLEVFRGCNESAVYEDYRDTTSRFIRWSLASRTELITFSPFNKTCVGIKTLYSYSAKFKIKRKDIENPSWGPVRNGIHLSLYSKEITSNSVYFLWNTNSWGWTPFHMGTHDQFYFFHNVFFLTTKSKVHAPQKYWKSLSKSWKSRSEAGNHSWVWKKLYWWLLSHQYNFFHTQL